MKSCLRCGKEFEPKRPKSKFCSDTCRAYWHREQKTGIPVISRKNIKEEAAPGTPVRIMDDILTMMANDPERKPTPLRYYEKPELLITDSKKKEYDFTGVKFLNVEEYTNYPLSDKPKNKWEAIEWYKKRTDDLAKIKNAWNSRDK